MNEIADQLNFFRNELLNTFLDEERALAQLEIIRCEKNRLKAALHTLQQKKEPQA